MRMNSMTICFTTLENPILWVFESIARISVRFTVVQTRAILSTDLTFRPNIISNSLNHSRTKNSNNNFKDYFKIYKNKR